MSLPTPEESRREIAENKRGNSKFKGTLDFFYPPDFAKQDREQEAEDEI